jgi:PAS domain S-box-containing protein
MPPPSDPRSAAGTPVGAREAMRERVIGLGERSMRKSYYPELVQRLRELERFRALLDQSRDAILLLELPSFRVVDATASACDQFGRTRGELLAGSLADRVPAAVMDVLRATVGADGADGVGCTIPTAITRQDGREVPVEISVRTVRFGEGLYAVAVARDVSERRDFEGQLLQASKLEGLGRLAGGVAHDFNNLLTAILGNAELMRAELPAGHPALDSLDEILAAGARATDLVRQLLVFARRVPVSPSRIDLGVMVGESNRMLRRLLGEDITVTVVSGAAPVVVEADPSQMQQLLVNLAVNARDAMPSGGRVQVGTTRVDIGAGQAAELGVRPGPHVELSVMDTGVGMGAETMEHIFEPFYTTKELGKGTGLGLATCHGIVRQLGGAISVASELGVGTTFRVLLPSAAGEPDPAGPPRAYREDRGTERVLLVEDDESIRRMAAAGLRMRGYTVREVAGAEEALSAAIQHPVDIVVSDLVMPGTDGLALTRRLAAVAPDVPVVLVSGHPRAELEVSGGTGSWWPAGAGAGTIHPVAPHEDAHPPRPGQPTAFLAKPYTPDRLAWVIRVVLDKSRASGGAPGAVGATRLPPVDGT